MKSFGYLLKQGIRGIFSHGFMSAAAVLVTVACLLIVGSCYALMYNVNVLVEDLNKTNEVLVIIDEKLSLAEARQVETNVRREPNVHNAVFKSREEALEEFKEAHENDPVFNGIAAEDLRHRVVVTLVDNSKLEETVARLHQINGVAKITASYELAEGFSSLQKVLNIAFWAVLAMLAVVSGVIIANTVKLAMMDRKDEIAIMKMVGATNSFIRVPFLIQSVSIGLFAGGIAFGLQWLLYNMVVAGIEQMDSLQMFRFVPFSEILLPMVGIFALAGAAVGFVGSWTSIQKYMNV